MYLGIDKIVSFFSEQNDALVCLAAFVRFVIIVSSKKEKEKKDEDFNLLTADRNWLYTFYFYFSSPSRP